MPLTPSQKSAAFRQRRAEKMARMEAALREIVQEADNMDGKDAGLNLAAIIAEEALNPGKEMGE